MTYKCIVITGASAGLGEEIALQLAPYCQEMILVARKFRQTIPSNATTFLCDLTLCSEQDNLLQLLQEKPVDLLINCAGSGLYGPCLSHPMQEQLKILELNALALTKLTLFIADHMKKNGGGTIVNVASAAAFSPFPEFCIYSASKAYVVHFSLALNAELASSGVHILTSCPGQIATDFRVHASIGRYAKFSGHVMTKRVAAKKIIAQIQSKKPLLYFDLYYKIGTFLLGLLPVVLRMHLLQKSIQKRS